MRALNSLSLLILLPLASASSYAQEIDLRGYSSDTLVSNIGQLTDSELDANRKSQGFTTGSHSNGYDLSRIILAGSDFSSSNGNTVTLHEGSRTGRKVADFTSSTFFFRLTLTPVSAVALYASTEYFVVTTDDFGSGTWRSTAATDEDRESLGGWGVNDNYESFSTNDNAWVTMSGSLNIFVGGSERSSPPPAPPAGPTPPAPPAGPTPPAHRLYLSPTNLAASFSDDSASVRVDWTRPGAEYIARTDHFLIWVRRGHITADNFILGPDTLVAQVDKSENGTTVAGLSVGEKYTFFVKSVYEDDGQGSASRIALPVLTTSGSLDTISISAEGEQIPGAVRLYQNYPNPFNPSTTIRYVLPQAGDVRLVAYDMLGREVAVLVDGPQAAGAHTARFDAGHLPNGAYAYRLEAGGKTVTRAMLLLK